jgi:hypothetical protein
METVDQSILALDVQDYERELPQVLIEELFDHARERAVESNRNWPSADCNFRPASAWARTVFYELASDEQAEDEEAAPTPEETVLDADEVTREAISFASGPVVIEVTHEQAAELRQFHGRGAWSQ